MTDPDNRIGSLYRATRQEIPPAHLDQAILSAARSTARRRRLRWIVPASSAALMLLGLSLSYRFLEDLARLEAPEAVTPAGLKQRPATEQVGGRAAKRPPDSAAQPAPVLEESDALQRPAKAPSPRSTIGPSSESKIRQVAPATPEAQPGAEAPAPTMSRALEAEEAAPARSPDEWLRQIRAYKEAGDFEAARDLLRELLRQFPGTEPPQDLRDLLATP